MAVPLASLAAARALLRREALPLAGGSLWATKAAPPPGAERLLRLHGALLGLESEILCILPELLVEPPLQSGAQPLALPVCGDKAGGPVRARGQEGPCRAVGASREQVGAGPVRTPKRGPQAQTGLCRPRAVSVLVSGAPQAASAPCGVSANFPLSL